MIPKDQQKVKYQLLKSRYEAYCENIDKAQLYKDWCEKHKEIAYADLMEFINEYGEQK